MSSFLARSLAYLKSAFLAASTRVRQVGLALAPLVASLALPVGEASAQCQPEWLPNDWFGIYSNDFLADLEVRPNGDLIVCGTFSYPFSNIARWDGLQWTPVGSGLASSAFCSKTLPDGRLAVGSSNAVMVWDGATWTQLGGSLNGAVVAMAIRNGELVIAGDFTLAGGVPANRVARWDGTNWVPLGSGMSGTVLEVAVLSNGDLIAAGTFTSPGQFVARWDGASWTAMGTGPSSSPSQSVDVIAQDPNTGTIWMAGTLQFGWGGFVERWTGSAWVPVNANAGSSEIRSLKFLPSGELLAAGSIYLNGQGPEGMATWNGTSWQFPTPIPYPYGMPLATNAHDAEVLTDGTIVAMQLYDIRRYGCPTGLADSSTYGEGCYRRSRAFLEHFPAGAAGIDLSNSTLRLVPSGTSYAVQYVPGAPSWYVPSSLDLGLGDDENSMPIGLPFSLPVLGAIPVADIQVGSNGFVNMSYYPGALAYYGNRDQFLNWSQCHAAMWSDLDPATGSGSGTIHVDVDSTAQVVYVTWLGVQQYGDPGSVSTFQIALFATGVVEYRYLTCANSVAPALTGWSPGGGVPNPDSRDLTAGPFTTSPTDFWPLEHRAVGRPAVGTSFYVETGPMPANTLLVGTVIGWGKHDPGIELSAYGMPGCRQFVSADVVDLQAPSVFNTWSHGISIPAHPSFLGAHLLTQGIAFVPGANPLGLVTSNGVDLHFGRL